LEFTFSSEFTDAGVEILTKMMQLKYVHIKVHDTEIYKNEEHIDSYLKLLWLLNLIAGRVPNLTIADFGIKKEASMLFIGAHGHYFPDKNLTIRQVE
jgi:hypothetical protein